MTFKFSNTKPEDGKVSILSKLDAWRNALIRPKNLARSALRTPISQSKKND